MSFSYFLPFDGVPHAGGEYYLRHTQALLEAGHEITLVVPATAENVAAVPPAGVGVVLVHERRTLTTALADVVAAQLRHAVLPPRFTSAVVRDHRVLAAVRDADLLEFQWTPSAALYRPLRRLTGATAPGVCVAHDVVGQSLKRQAAQPGLGAAKRALRLLRLRVAYLDERRFLRRMALVLTFSSKDEDLLKRYGVAAQVIDPPLADTPGASPARSHGVPRLLFVGAFDRMENQDAASWLLDEIWPEIAEAHPEANLDLVGAHPTSSMQRAAASSPAISVTGYVDELQPYYSAAALAVVPLRVGAGVKFKVVTAMLEGVPVVTTTIGAEGIADRRTDLFVAIEDDPRDFARAVIRHLDDPREGQERAATARRVASERYGWPGFRDRLIRLYRIVLGA